MEEMILSVEEIYKNAFDYEDEKYLRIIFEKLLAYDFLVPVDKVASTFTYNIRKISIIIILPKRHWNAWKRKVVIFIVQKTADRFRFCTGKVSGRLDNRKTAVLTGVNYDSIMAEALKRGKIL